MAVFKLSCFAIGFKSTKEVSIGYNSPKFLFYRRNLTKIHVINDLIVEIEKLFSMLECL